eukprot:CAMPEP_0181334164 /NCGR_PEP_ID=MMETSP1101-20121128/26096_1 /TAXON_ID=46948 /ORGANISM="Rhodomonas abbreviata, Strain Caron Lab Isolate" /LENGTH=514 /DNA_ID=CAMNT_0023444087 /DNA_START=251 /DNA_END=1795 /DNA_ORIENTATION=-
MMEKLSKEQEAQLDQLAQELIRDKLCLEEPNDKLAEAAGTAPTHESSPSGVISKDCFDVKGQGSECVDDQGSPSSGEEIACDNENDTEHPTTATPKQGGHSRLERQIFVGGIPCDVTPPAFRAWADQMFPGRVVNAVLVLDRLTHTRSRGFGFVTFDSPQVADQASKSRLVSFGSRLVEIKRAQHLSATARASGATNNSPSNRPQQSQPAPNAASQAAKTGPPLHERPSRRGDRYTHYAADNQTTRRNYGPAPSLQNPRQQQQQRADMRFAGRQDPRSQVQSDNRRMQMTNSGGPDAMPQYPNMPVGFTNDPANGPPWMHFRGHPGDGMHADQGPVEASSWPWPYAEPPSSAPMMAPFPMAVAPPAWPWPVPAPTWIPVMHNPSMVMAPQPPFVRPAPMPNPNAQPGPNMLHGHPMAPNGFSGLPGPLHMMPNFDHPHHPPLDASGMLDDHPPPLEEDQSTSMPEDRPAPAPAPAPATATNGQHEASSRSQEREPVATGHENGAQECLEAPDNG